MVIRLMNDYGADWPLWEDGLLPEGEPAVPPELERRLLAGADGFGRSRWETGWDTVAERDHHVREGESLLADLQSALPDHEIVLDLWETDVRGEG